jgi:Protein of unknown function (DUF3182)
MANGNVVIYFSRFGKPLQTHHKVVLDLAARTIAKIKGYDFGGNYDPARDYPGPLYFVPDDTVLLNEALCVGIRSPNDLYGGVVPCLFAKTKAITHGLVDRCAERPLGWCSAFSERVLAGVHRLQRPRCPSGGQSDAHARTGPSEETGKRIRKRSDCVCKLE